MPILNQAALSKRKNKDICFSEPIWYHKVPYIHTSVTHTPIFFVLWESMLNLQSHLNFFEPTFGFNWTYKVANFNTSSQKQNGQGSQLPSYQLLPQVFKLRLRKTLGEDVTQLFLGLDLPKRYTPLHDLLPEPHRLGTIVLASRGELGRDRLGQD